MNLLQNTEMHRLLSNHVQGQQRSLWARGADIQKLEPFRLPKIVQRTASTLF